MKTQYVYLPGILDLTDPTVIRGKAIARGSVVTVSRKDRPPQLPPCFTPILDPQGNCQIVFKRALIPLNSASAAELLETMFRS